MGSCCPGHVSTPTRPSSHPRGSDYSLVKEQLLLKSYVDWPYKVRRRSTFFPSEAGEALPRGSRGAESYRSIRRCQSAVAKIFVQPSRTANRPVANPLRSLHAGSTPARKSRSAINFGSVIRRSMAASSPLALPFFKDVASCNRRPGSSKTLAAVQSTAADPNRVVGPNPTNSAAGQYTRLLSRVNPSRSFSLPPGRRVNVALTLSVRRIPRPVHRPPLSRPASTALSGCPIEPSPPRRHGAKINERSWLRGCVGRSRKPA